jgi:hypothetical protein
LREERRERGKLLAGSYGWIVERKRKKTADPCMA